MSPWPRRCPQSVLSAEEAFTALVGGERREDYSICESLHCARDPFPFPTSFSKASLTVPLAEYAEGNSGKGEKGQKIGTLTFEGGEREREREVY